MTDRHFSDIVASSPDRRYRLEARATTRREGPFQSDFVYSLDAKEGRSERPVWHHAHLSADPPVDVFVADAGWVVVRTRGDELIAVGVDGRVRPPLPLLVPGRIDEAYVSRTTAGPRWEAARWGFRDFDGRTHFVVSTRWGRHVVLDLETGAEATASHHADLHAALQAELRSENDVAERWARIAATLNSSNADLPQNAQAVVDATIASLDERQSNALMWLRRIEADERGVAYESHDGLRATVYPLRQLGRVGLRRLRQETTYGRPSCVVHQVPAAATTSDAGSRGFGASLIKADMSVHSVLASAGAPERILGAGGVQTWEWDVEHDTPFTVVVHWSRPDWTVAATAVVPPRWEGDWCTPLLRRLAGCALRGEQITVDADAEDVVLRPSPPD